MFHRSKTWKSSAYLLAALAMAASARSAYANGACCKTDGTCADVADLSACNALSGFYLGDGTLCATSDCSRGACVRATGTGGTACSVTSKSECNLKEGYWAGAGTNCNSILVNGIYYPPVSNSGQINVSGSSALQNFIIAPASTNDYLNINGDHIYCRQPDLINGPIVDTGNPFSGFADTDCDTAPDSIDQLAPLFNCPGGTLPQWWGQWLVQYRAVGSIEGYGEFIDYQLTGAINAVPPNPGFINRLQFATGGVPTPNCTAADCNPGPANDSGTFVCPTSVDVAAVDVPSIWGVRGSAGSPSFDKKPSSAGYGLNSFQTYPNNGIFQTPQLASLSRPPFGALNLYDGVPANANANTLFDNNVAWVPFSIIANRGTGLKDVRFTQLQHLWVTGRMPNGENLVAATRDVGSGTRNASMNSLGIDPSWGRGDNFGPRTDITADSNLGLSVTAGSPIFKQRTQPTQLGATGVLNNAVLNWRLSVGYTSLSSAAGAAVVGAGNLEILNLCKDVDASGVAIPGFACVAHGCDGGGSCTSGPDLTESNNGFVRPSVNTVLDNANPLCGWQLGGLATFVTRGDPVSGIQPMSNAAARDYANNIISSIAAATAAPGGSSSNFMPGESMANLFFLPKAVDARPASLTTPTDFGSNPGFNQAAQDYARCASTLNTSPVPAWGSKSVAGKVPARNNLTVVPGVYSDGSVNGSYDNGTGALTLASGTLLNQRNQTTGDFNYDAARNIRDIPEMMKALKNPRKYENDEFTFSGTGVPTLPGTPPLPNPLGGLTRNFVVPEIIGDFNGDGNFDVKDIRYFADGLAIDPATGKLNRCLGWELIDEWWLFYKVGAGSAYPGAGRPEYAGPKPPWAPTLPAYLPAWPDPRVIGAAMADIAGNAASPGWEPTGQDGVVDGKDIDYVYANFGDFTNLRFDAVRMDLSADMNGDLKVDQLDVDKIVRDILCTHYGDRNLDGVVNAADDPTPNLGMTPAGWADGDFDGDKIVTAADVAIFNANLGAVSSCRKHCISDMNCDGKRDGRDVQAMIRAILDPTGYDLTYASCGCVRHNADSTGDGIVDALDVPGFVGDLLATTDCPN